MRWLIPLLKDDTSSHQLIEMLKVHLKNCNSSKFHQIPLLFPHSRRAKLQSERINTLDIIYATVDCIPKNFDNIQINPTAALALPLVCLLQPIKKIPSKASKLIGLNLFKHNQSQNHILWRTLPEFDTIWGTSPRLIST